MYNADNILSINDDFILHLFYICCSWLIEYLKLFIPVLDAYLLIILFGAICVYSLFIS